VSRSTTGSVRPLARRHAALLVAAAAGAAILLAGCGAGQVAETARKRPSVPGVNVNVGDIAIRNALVEPPPSGEWKVGSDVPLDMRLTNLGREADTLVGAEVLPEDDGKEVAEKVELRVGGEAPTGAPGATPAPLVCITPEPVDVTTASPGATGPASPPVTASPPGTVTPSATGTSPSAPIAPLPEQRIEIQPGCLVILDSTTQQLVLVKVKKELIPGDVVKVTLGFERAGSVTLDLPVAPPPSPLPRESPVTEDGEEEGGHS
jgi:copper(I)-binding protein